MWYDKDVNNQGDNMKTKYTIKKFNGDDSYSWAVFRAQDVRGMRSPIFYGDARPVMSGLTRSDAQYHKKTQLYALPHQHVLSCRLGAGHQQSFEC